MLRSVNYNWDSKTANRYICTVYTVCYVFKDRTRLCMIRGHEFPFTFKTFVFSILHIPALHFA
jgi:hypothetical protein